MPGALPQLLGSLVAVVAIVAVTWALGFRRAARIESHDEARELFSLAPGGFEPEAIALDKQGRAAIARDRQGRVAVLVPHGNQFVFCLLAPGSPISAEGGVLAIHALPAVKIEPDDDAQVWANTDSGDNSG